MNNSLCILSLSLGGPRPAFHVGGGGGGGVTWQFVTDSVIIPLDLFMYIITLSHVAPYVSNMLLFSSYIVITDLRATFLTESRFLSS